MGSRSAWSRAVLSLLEIMLRPFAARLLTTYRRFVLAGFDVSGCESDQTPITREMRTTLRKWCSEFQTLASELEMPRTLSTTGHIASEIERITPQEYGARIYQIEENLDDDLADIAFESISRERVAFYSRTYGDEANLAFPSAAFDIAEAHVCFSLGRFSASVFHVIRASEYGLKALARAAGVRGQIDFKKWGKIDGHCAKRSGAAPFRTSGLVRRRVELA
jgi:hypothetical protein